MSYTLHTKIETNADTAGIDQYDKKLKQVEKTGVSLSDTLKTIGRGLFAGAAVASVIKMAEDFGEASGIVASNAKRLGISVEDMWAKTKRASDITHESFPVMNKLVNSTSLAIQGFNGDMSLAVDVATSLSGALKLSGTTASKTTMVLEQASKMFASGEINSRGFVGLLVEAPVLVDKLSESFGMSAKEMKKALENETISMEKLLTVVGSFADEFSSSIQAGPMNFSHFMTHIKNEFFYFFGEIEEGTRILSATFKTVVYVLQSLTGTIRYLVKAVGGWNNAMLVLITMFVFLKKDIIFLKAQQLGAYFYRMAAACMASSKGLGGVVKGLFSARMAASAFWAAASLGMSIGIALFIDQFMLMAEGKPNFITFGIFMLQDHVMSALQSIGNGLKAFGQLAMTILSPIISGFSFLKGGVSKAAGLLGFGKGDKTEEQTIAPNIPTPTAGTNPEGKGVVNNNNQQIKIDIKSNENPAEIKQAVIEGVLEASNASSVDTDKLEKRTNAL